jgi:hypothetical protein
MQYQYVVAKDDETQQVEVIGRFSNGIAEVYLDGKWKLNGTIYSLQRDGLLDEITEAEAMKLIEQRKIPQFQAA